MPEIIPVGDTELFVVSDAGSVWSIPIHATPYEYGDPKQELYLVTPALSLLKGPMDALTSVLQGACYSKQENKPAFWFLRSVLPTVAKKAQGITPKFYFKWDNQRDVGRLTEATVEFHEREDVTPDQEKFLRYLVNQTALLDITQARILWRALSQCGFVWLAKEKKPIDFGLFKVTPLPYRRNWKERVYEMMREQIQNRGEPKGFVHAMKQSRPERDRWAEERMPTTFNDTTLMDVDYARHYCHWNLELEESTVYKRLAGDAEAAELRARGKPRYADKILRQIQARLPAIMDALTLWCKEISRPCGAVEQKRMDSGPYIVPLKKPGKLLPLCPKHPSIPVVVSDQPMLSGPTALQRVEEKVKIGMREMHALQLTNGDVRNGGQGNGAPDHEGVD